MTTAITVIGSIGGTPERRTTSRSDPYARFRMASTDRRTDPEGNWVDGNTSWFEVQAYGVLGENALASLVKGQRVVVHGDLSVRDWTAQDGTRHSITQIRASAIGHDLLFGTTVFSRTGKRSAPASQTAAPAQEDGGWNHGESVDRSDQWPTPMAPRIGSDAGALVGVGAGTGVAPDEDVPF